MNTKEVKGREAMGFLATKPTMIVTTLHESKVVNAGVFGAYTNLSGEHLGVAVATGHHTYANIKRAGEFVVNIPGADIVKAMARLAEHLPPEVSEVEEAGLTPKPGLTIETPSIAECVAAVEFTFDREVPIAGHAFLVGRVCGGWIREDCLDDDGKINIFKARVFKDFKYPKPLYVLPGEVIEG
ncbi:MAG: flavin reductase family protein [Anaerolineaceae bacterium]|nr:flavin reductase family protein [Anaerolineaceae bacterium]